jgi:L-ascorbate oxidase
MWRPTRVNGSALWHYDKDAASTIYEQGGHVSNVTTPLNLNTTVFLPNETFGWVSLDIVPHNKSVHPPTQGEVSRTVYLDGAQLVDAVSFLNWENTRR